MSFLPAYSDFEKNFPGEKPKLVWTTVPADLETPVSAYLKLTGDSKNSFLLESVEGGATLGRYSSMGLERIWSGPIKRARNKTRCHRCVRS